MPPTSNVRSPPSRERRPDGGALPVYPPRADSFLLLPFARVAAGSSFLEVGTGAGEIALAAARRGARVVATDLNPHALRQLRERARGERLRVDVVRTDLARGLGRFDRVVFNPPYLPTRPEERDPDRWHNLALDGGSDGTDPSARWIDELGEHLTGAGEGYLLVSTVQPAVGRASLARRWGALGGTLEVVARQPLEGERLEVWRLVAPNWPSQGPAPRG
jgi:release factor glutamine methyltransferase